MRLRRHLLFPIVLSLGLVACSGPQGLPGQEVIVPPTTEVLDETAQSALQGVDAQGTLTFEASAELLASLEVNDVVVSGISGATPNGLLRKITAIRQEGNQLIVETTGAEIRDAIHQGSLSVRIELEPDDLATTMVLQQGVEAQGFEYTLNTDFGTGDKIEATGTVSVDPVIELDIGIGCNETKFGFCIELPDLNVHALVGVQETARLNFSGNVAANFTEEFALVSHSFAPIQFAIGPVPVVITPKLVIYVGAEGSLSASFAFAVDQNLTLTGGFDYNSDRGFEDISQNQQTFERSSSDFAGEVDARAFAGVRFELLLYGLIGPYGSLEAGPHFQASQTGLPGVGELLWNLDGCVWMNVGINSIDVLDIQYEKELLDSCLSFDNHSNRPPSTSILSPNPGSQVYQGVPFDLRSQVVDSDGQAVTCRWTSSRTGDPLPSSSCQPTVTFDTIGFRTLTLTGTDQAGESSVDTVTFQVQEQPLIIVDIASPNEGENFAHGSSIALAGSASEGTSPYDFTWSLRYPTDASGNGGSLYQLGSGSNLTWTPSDSIDFGHCEESGNARLQLNAVDAADFEGSTFIVIRFGQIC